MYRRGLTWCLTLVACGDAPAPQRAVAVRGSDTLVQVVAAWSEAYAKVDDGVDVSASGGGSGTGIAGLIESTADVATSSREIRDEERAEITRRRGAPPREIIVGFDALAIYLHPRNPVRELSLAQLREIWCEDGNIQDWSQLDERYSGRIVLVGRQNSSGTYDYFRASVCGEDAAGRGRELRGGISELNGSAEVVEKVASSPLALGYTGMGYKTERVAWAAIASTAFGVPVAPSLASARDGSYPLTRPLYLYAMPSSGDVVAAFLEWTLSRPAQAVVGNEGYVPVGSP